MPKALEAGLKPILCVGETEAEREAGDTERKLRHQIGEDLERVADERLGDVVIAYEPIWAIGTGLVATPEQAQEACAFVRALVGSRSEEAAQRVRILYGGSVKPDNAAELLALPDVDGALVGGASLEAGVVRGDRGGRRLMRAARRTGRAAGAARRRSSCSTAGGSRRTGRATPSRSRDTPVFDELWARYPHTQLTACGRAVGLPDGQMGNSEVGHLNLGAGAVVRQDLTRIDDAVADGTLAQNAVLRAAFARRRARPPDRARVRRRRALRLGRTSRR